MVVSGYAWAYREYLSDDNYLRLENDARSHKRGLWAALWNNEQEPVYPSQFRRNK